jgi:hypothetical protein
MVKMMLIYRRTIFLLAGLLILVSIAPGSAAAQDLSTPATYSSLPSSSLIQALGSKVKTGSQPEEPLDPPGRSLVIKVNFQPPEVETPLGMLIDDGSPYGDRGNGYVYGWSADIRAHARERNAPNSPDFECDTLNQMQMDGDFTWEIALPEGFYYVRLVAGDPLYYDSLYRIQVEGHTLINGAPNHTSPWIEGSALIRLQDGKLTLSSAAGAVNNKINFVEITAAREPAFNLFLPQVQAR